jgi:hypothetical protein
VVAATQAFALLSEMDAVLPAPASHVTAATRRSPAVVVMALADKEEACPSLVPVAAWRNEIVAGVDEEDEKVVAAALAD